MINGNMLSWVNVIRLLRRRLVLGVIFAISLTYCALSLFHHEKRGGSLVDNDTEDDDELFFSTGKPYLWQMQMISEGDDVLDEEVMSVLNDSQLLATTCRNSVQGKALIVDELGLVCTRAEVLPSGCCSADLPQSGNILAKNYETVTLAPAKRERYSCQTCNADRCCAIYEYCVSCCLHPGKMRLKRPRENRNQKTNEAPANENRKSRDTEDKNHPSAMRQRLRALDRFQVCLATCRTSSASVRHENTYKDPHSKHCYGPPPQVTNSNQRYRRDLNPTLMKNNNNNDNLAEAVVEPSSTEWCENYSS